MPFPECLVRLEVSLERAALFDANALPLPNVDGDVLCDVVERIVELPLLRINLFGFAMICWHFGIWRAAALSLNVRPQ